MPINTTSLAHYFGGACILPSRYYTNKPEDLQDRFPGLLLLATHLGTKQTNCCLEIALDDAECSDLIDAKDGFYLYEKPLPISRIKRILFANEEQRDTTIKNIRLGTAFVPENIIGIVSEFETVDASNVSYPNDIVINDFSEKQMDFDKILGGLAVMKVAHPDYMNYSENYFSTLSYFNNIIFNTLTELKLKINKQLQPILIDNKANRLHMYLHEPISDALLEKVAAEEKQTIQKDQITKLIDLKNLDKLTYIFAVLNTYGTDKESKKKRVDRLFLSRFSDNDIKPGKEEGIALSYGISRGYSAFRNSYEHNGIKVDVKYKLDTLLDYYTIESIYQYVYNKKIPGELPVLNFVKRKNPETPKCDTDYIIIDEYVIGKKKPSVSSIEYLRILLSRFFQESAFELGEKLVTTIRDIVYTDTKKEIGREQAEAISHYKELTKKQQIEIDSLKQQLEATQRNANSYIPHTVSDTWGSQQPKPVHKPENPENQLIAEEQLVPIIKEAARWGSKKKQSLVSAAQKQNITLNDNDKVEDIVLKIMTSHINNQLF